VIDRTLASMVGPGVDASAASRSRERYRRVGLTFAASAGARMVSVLVAFVSVPLVVGAIGVEGYGLWATIASTTALLAFADLGLGNGLLNITSAAHGQDDRRVAHHAVSSAWVLLWGVAATITVAFALLYPIVDWGQVFNVTGSLASEAGPAMAVFFVCFALGLPLAVAQKVQLGYQEGFANSLWVAGGSLLGLLGLVVAIQMGASLPWLVFAFAAGPVGAAAGNTVVLFFRRRPWLRPSLRRADRRTAARLVRVGLLFFVLQAAVAVAFQSDVIVAARVVGPEAAAQYSVGSRMFLFVPAVIAMFLIPLWPAYSEAYARGDFDWIRRTVRLSTAGTFVATASASVVLVVFADPLLRVWLGAPFKLPFELLVGLALWAVVFATFNSLSMLLNALGEVRFLVVVASLMAIASIALSVLMASRIGVPGVIWGTVVAYLLFAAIPIGIYVPRVMRRLHDDLAVAPSEPQAHAGQVAP